MITISLKTDSDIPMYIQIYEYIKKKSWQGVSVLRKTPFRPFSGCSSASKPQYCRYRLRTASRRRLCRCQRKTRLFCKFHYAHDRFYRFCCSGLFNRIPYTFCTGIFEFNPDAIDTTHFPYTVWKSIGKTSWTISQFYRRRQPGRTISPDTLWQPIFTVPEAYPVNRTRWL